MEEDSSFIIRMAVAADVKHVFPSFGKWSGSPQPVVRGDHEGRGILGSMQNLCQLFTFARKG
jgi:hypothetical protein